MNMQTVVGLFEDKKEARQVIKELKSSGIAKDHIREITSASESAHKLEELTTHISEPDVHFYREGVRHGDTMIMVTAPDREAQMAAEIMARYNMVDVDARSRSYRDTGKEFALRDYGHDDVVLPVIEEELEVGKRAVERRRMRIYSQTTERPVEEQIRLRDEHINVERRPVNRDVTQEDMATLREGSFEMTETDEVPVVSKRARVIEEVIISKDAHEHTETIRDSVRRTEVDVEQSGQVNDRHQTGHHGSFGHYDTDFRSHYQQHYASNDYTYEEYLPVYEYGNTLAMNEIYQDRDWNDIEPDARRRWEERNPGTWEQFKDGIHYAWEKVRGRR